MVLENISMKRTAVVISVFIFFILHSGVVSAKQTIENGGHTLELVSSDHSLDTAFAWAKKTALGYTRTGDPVGKWYDAALPGRESFCMRDVSHQAVGAYFLGLESYTRNMLVKFAQNISASKKWCSYWEIDKYNKPTPVDYVSDKHFWYDLPANFDVMQACYEMYELTGDSSLLLSAPFYAFHYHTIHDYTKAWDSNHDGIMNAADKSSMGIASYVENTDSIFTGADLLLAQSRGYRIFSYIMKMKNKPDSAKMYMSMSNRLKEMFDHEWWNTKEKRFYDYVDFSGRYRDLNYVRGALLLALHFGLVTGKHQREHVISVLDKCIRMKNVVEEHSYLAMYLYRYDKPEEAYRSLMFSVDPSVKRRTYPEVSYAFIGSVVEGLMGVNLNAPGNTVTTIPRLPEHMKYIELKHIPWKSGYITVEHDELKSTTLISNAKGSFVWRAMFPGTGKKLFVNHKEVKAKEQFDLDGNPEIYTDVTVKPGESCIVSKSNL